MARPDPVLVVCLLLLACGVPRLRAQSERPWRATADGRFVVADAAPRRPWSEELERGIQARALHVVTRASRADGRYGSTWFENEKRSYGIAMLSWLAGHEQQARAFLQAPDAGAKEWSAPTNGIDLFPAFTLKHQVRKWFYFGRWLDADYRAQMREGMRLWTEQDPLRRPHPAFKGAEGWTPEARNSWVDVRSTDNLKLMRDVAVYLFAAETGNDATRDLYAGELRAFVDGLYRYGMGEWDSENYLGHSLGPLLCLHDFAADPAMRELATAALDWLTITAALKYRRGAFGGPDRRDYDHGYPFGGSAAAMLWLWFGDAALLPEHFESDEVHPITSSYRPPEVAVRLARKQFPTPRTMRAAKPDRAPWLGEGVPAPAYHETLHFGRHYQLGTLGRGTQAPDVNGFTLMVDDPERGCDVLLVAPTTDPTAIASPRYREGTLQPRIRVVQRAGTALHLAPEGAWPLLFALPEAVAREVVDGVLFLVWEDCKVAVVPCNVHLPRVDEALTAERNFVVKQERGEQVLQPRRPGAPRTVVLRADRAGPGAYGFVLEVGEREEFVDLAAFQLSVLERSRRRRCDAERGRLTWEAADGSVIDLLLDDDHPAEASPRAFAGPVLQQDWGGGRLSVEFDGEPVWSKAVDE